MAIFEDMEPERRVGAGLLFLIIAMGVLVVQPATPIITAVIASINLLISATFLITVGRDTTEKPAYDVGFWLLSVIVALAMYLFTTLLLTGTLYIFQVLVFIIGFGLILGFLAELRAKLTNHRKQ
ncbi:hypothetical protein E2L06_18420 [Haloterrigena sp. H1]|uniref:hypothetical protein n=1 Tax=Haloterrigena sp. H1 TaxID=2552943 RepID=UPI00110E5B71|nr:hypothetical protein [Haloterrigena sp. H1]TMT80232.1 hypothetical protein E2L06_18420 [Haloterrigena sp. H1]